MSVDVLAAASLSTCSDAAAAAVQEIFSSKTEHINITMYITSIKLSEGCDDRNAVLLNILFTVS